MRTLFLLFLTVLAASSAAAQQERRLALVLANEDYPTELGRLTNTHEDAAKVEAALRDTGFAVTKVLDADADGLEAAITNFEIAIDREAADGDKVVAFIYASMHGAAADVNGRTRNFLLPAREQIASTGQLLRKGIRMDQLVAGLGATAADAVIIVSDACRNELGTSFNKSTTKGFVPINVGNGVMVAYATAPGATTPDDGVFADLLSRELRVSGRRASIAMFSAVEAVASVRPSDGQPFLSPGGLPSWFCFNGCEQLDVVESVAPVKESNKLVFKDCAECPEMVSIPGGDYLRGARDAGRNRDAELPVRTVRIKPFAAGRHEVTWDQWLACASDGICNSTPVNRAGGDEGWGLGKRPVINVNWQDAQAFVRWLNTKVDGEPYRLLTEAEWEYSARAGVQGSLSSVETSLCDVANYSSSLELDIGLIRMPGYCDDGFAGITAPAGSFEPNAFGLYDMLGNVTEWVEDCYEEGYSKAPTDGSAHTTMFCRRRSFRGGTFNSLAGDLEFARRTRDAAGVRGEYLGFRVAKDTL